MVQLTSAFRLPLKHSPTEVLCGGQKQVTAIESVKMEARCGCVAVNMGSLHQNAPRACSLEHITAPCVIPDVVILNFLLLMSSHTDC